MWLETTYLKFKMNPIRVAGGVTLQIFKIGVKFDSGWFNFLGDVIQNEFSKCWWLDSYVDLAI